jgi:predicted histone-like DNA-binding protein
MAGFIIQELPEEMTNGKKVVYPKMQNYTMLNYNTVVKHIHDYSGSFSEGIIKGVLDTLVLELKSKLTEGHSIKIDGLGVFSLSLGFDMSSPSEQEIAENRLQASINGTAESKTKYRKVCIKGINFKPDPELLKEMNASTDFQRMMSEVKTPKKNPHSRTERLSIAQALIDKNGQMTLTDYVLATGLERSAASRELKTFTNDPTSGITTKGSHSHKVWVKKIAI